MTSLGSTSLVKGGIALVGAAAIALTPVTPAGEQLRTAESAAVSLRALSVPTPSQLIEGYIEAFTYALETGGGVRVNNPTPATDPLEAITDVAAGFPATAVRTVQAILQSPLAIGTLLSAALSGDDATASAALRNILDASLWANDPALFALRDALPAPIGGATGLVMNVRELWRQSGIALESTLLTALGWPNPFTPGVSAPTAAPAITTVSDFVDAVNTAVATSGAYAYNNPRAVTGLAQGPLYLAAGLVASAVRGLQTLVGGPAAIGTLITKVIQGDQAGATEALKNIIDAPLWVADPTIFAVRDTVPAPVGGTTGLALNTRELWRQTNLALAGAGGAAASPASSAAPEAISRASAAQITSTRTVVLTVTEENPAPSGASDNDEQDESAADNGPTAPPRAGAKTRSTDKPAGDRSAGKKSGRGQASKSQ